MKERSSLAMPSTLYAGKLCGTARRIMFRCRDSVSWRENSQDSQSAAPFAYNSDEQQRPTAADEWTLSLVSLCSRVPNARCGANTALEYDLPCCEKYMIWDISPTGALTWPRLAALKIAMQRFPNYSRHIWCFWSGERRCVAEAPTTSDGQTDNMRLYMQL